MTLGDVATLTRFLTGTDTVSYTDAQMLIAINIWYQKVADMIFGSQDNSDFDDQRATNYPIVTTPMVANQRDYTIGVNERMLKIKRVDACYDGSNSYRATAFDTGTFPYGLKFDNASSVDAQFDANFNIYEPRWDFAYNAIWIAPMPVQANEDAGGFIRVEWERSVVPFTTSDYTSVLTDSTVVPGFDLPFHPILAYGAAWEYAVAKQLPQLKQIQGMLQDFEIRLRQAYGRKDLDFQLNLQPGYDDSYGR